MKYKLYIVYKNNNSVELTANDIFLDNNKICYCKDSDFILGNGRITISYLNIKYVKITPLEDKEKWQIFRHCSASTIHLNF